MRLFALLLVLWSSLAIAQMPKLPSLNQPVIDEAGLLSAPEKEQLSGFIYELHAQGGPQAAILVVENLQGLPLEEFAIRTVEQWQLGQKQRGNGLLILISVRERQMRIEVGDGIEGDITDYDAHQYVDKILRPAFKNKEFARGLGEVLLQVASKFNIEIKGDTRWTRRKPRKQIPLGLLIPLFIIVYIIIRIGGGGNGGFSSGRGGHYYGGYHGGFGGSRGRSGGSVSWGGGGGGFSGGGASGSW